MATVANLVQHVRRGIRERWADVTFSSSYSAGGEAIDVPGSLGMRVVRFLQATPQAGYMFEWDYSAKKIQAFWAPGVTPTGTFTGTAAVASSGIVDDADTAATIGHELYVVRSGGALATTVVAEGSATGVLQDDDSAATNGVAIYLVIDETEFLPGYQLGHLEFVSPTNAHGSCTVFSGGPTLLIEDDDNAATNGVQVRAIAAGGGLEATIAGSNGTALVPLSDGQFLHIADSTTGSTPEIYFDEDAANTYERLQAVVVDNADEDYKLAEMTPALTRAAVLGGVRLAGLVSVGPGDGMVSQGTVGASGPEFDVVHDPAAAKLPGAALLFVQADGAGFNASLPGDEDVYIPTSTGDFIKVTHAASPAGVQVYWDHDSANAHERMKAVVVDNADETFSTDTALGWERLTPAGTITMDAIAEAALGEVDAGVNLSAVTTRIYANGK